MEKAILPLNQGQTLAATGFFEFLFNEDKELNISGPGGVGKTFLMGHMIDTILPQYFASCQLMGIEPEYTKVVMCATTNKAADVLSIATGRPVSTVHSFFNLKVQDDYSTGKQTISKTKLWEVHSKVIIFIDECSMIDKELYKFILEGSHKCKIVYVGDHCQLPPVKEKISKIYAKGIPFFELTEPMRTNIPELHALNNQMRQTVETGVFGGIQLVPGIIDLLDSDQFQAEIQQNFALDDHTNRIIGYTNNRVVNYNTYIREVRGLPEAFQKGEWLIINNALRVKTGMFSVEQELKIFDMDPTSTMMEVDEDDPTVLLEVHMCTMEDKFGELHPGIPVPVDRAHYTSLTKYFASSRNWNRYFFMKNTFPDLRQKDACTAYKAQGSTCDTVYIDLGDISTCRDAGQAACLLYVGISRARHRVAFYGELVGKFGFLIPPVE